MIDYYSDSGLLLPQRLKINQKERETKSYLIYTFSNGNGNEWMVFSSFLKQLVGIC